MRIRRTYIGCLLAAMGLNIAPVAAGPDMGFDVIVSLSDKAAAKLTTDHETIIAFASYYGDPKKSAAKHVDEVGQIDLSPSDETVEISGAGGKLHISGDKVEAKRIDWVNGPVKVNLNVASGRKAGPDNILSCDFIDGALSQVRKRPIKLHCSLIVENVENKLFP
ncbi:hypothetical protein WH297_14275 [Ochrobactrum vermis]|uniref:Organic solvent tolerance-like N-terminal domain-containing protein n=1 Tax=Ochrobactrum vermis TaxID=1827297 RepID=A0ABU8PGV9_9HYPH|nr:hypothetical protein [Ochrobactrum vermis]